MRVHSRVAGIVAAVGFAALTLSSCGSTSASSWPWTGHEVRPAAASTTASPVATGATTTQPTTQTTTAPPGSPDQGDPTTPNPTDTTTPDTATPTTTSTTVTTPADPTGPQDPNSPRADVIVGGTEHRTGGRHIALTFDDGPDPVWTPQILGLLAQYHASATFCLIGKNVDAHPALVRDIVAAGDALCDHTMTHDERLPGRPHQVKYNEINDAKLAILAAAPGAEIHYYRAPGGAFSKPGDPDPVQAIAAELGMQPLAWSIDTVDWTKPGVRHIVSAIESAGTHDVILMHDAGGDRSETLAALRIALPWLVAHGYQFDLPA
jgi:peptidoglycan/xylan/chitin deacetylase (PgdA/CDA1 family)